MLWQGCPRMLHFVVLLLSILPVHATVAMGQCFGTLLHSADPWLTCTWVCRITACMQSLVPANWFLLAEYPFTSAGMHSLPAEKPHAVLSSPLKIICFTMCGRIAYSSRYTPGVPLRLHTMHPNPDMELTSVTSSNIAPPLPRPVRHYAFVIGATDI
jgi:hypothetical protein